MLCFWGKWMDPVTDKNQTRCPIFHWDKKTKKNYGRRRQRKWSSFACQKTIPFITSVPSQNPTVHRVMYFVIWGCVLWGNYAVGEGKGRWKMLIRTWHEICLKIFRFSRRHGFFGNATFFFGFRIACCNIIKQGRVAGCRNSG